MIPEINLLPKYEEHSSALYRLFITGLIIIFILFTILIYFYFQTKSGLEEVEEQTAQLMEQKVALELQLVDSDSLAPESLDDAIRFAEEYVVPTSELIDKLLTMLPNNAYISNYEYVFGGIEIESQFETKSDASTYLADLLTSDYMNDVKIEHIESLLLEEVGAENEEEEVEDIYTVIPRYNVDYSLDVNIAELKEEAEEVE